MVWPDRATISASTRNSCKTSAACLSKQFIRSVVVLCQVQYTFPNFPMVRPSLELAYMWSLILILAWQVSQPNTKFFFMASLVLHTFLLRFINSHTFKSSLSSANQLPEAMPVQPAQLAERAAERSNTSWNFQRSKSQYDNSHVSWAKVPRVSRCLSRQIKS